MTTEHNLNTLSRLVPRYCAANQRFLKQWARGGDAYSALETLHSLTASCRTAMLDAGIVKSLPYLPGLIIRGMPDEQVVECYKDTARVAAHIADTWNALLDACK